MFTNSKLANDLCLNDRVCKDCYFDWAFLKQRRNQDNESPIVKQSTLKNQFTIDILSLLHLFHVLLLPLSMVPLSAVFSQSVSRVHTAFRHWKHAAAASEAAAAPASSIITALFTERERKKSKPRHGAEASSIKLSQNDLSIFFSCFSATGRDWMPISLRVVKQGESCQLAVAGMTKAL